MTLFEGFEDLLVWRILRDDALEAEELKAMLDDYYEIRKREEDGENGLPRAAGGPRNDRTGDGRLIAAPAKERAATGAEAPRNDRDGDGEKRAADSRPCEGTDCHSFGPLDDAEKAPEKKTGFTGPHAKLKRATLALWEELHAKGLTRGMVLQAADGCLTSEEVDAMLARRKVPLDCWTLFADTLAGLRDVEGTVWVAKA